VEEMKNLMGQERFNIVSEENKKFLIAFDEEMAKLGYEIYEVADAYNWAKNWIKAKYMINYAVAGIKAKKLVTHVFIKEDGIFLRLFALKKGANSLNTREMARSVIAPHRAYIESAPAHIKELFTIKNSDCDHKHENANGFCWRLDTYTIDGVVYEKCVGKGLDFWNPTIEKLPDYINLLAELNSRKTARK